jgi:hypothetical protein
MFVSFPMPASAFWFFAWGVRIFTTFSKISDWVMLLLLLLLRRCRFRPIS